MSIFDAEFIFCCPCIVEDIAVVIKTKCVKNDHFDCFFFAEQQENLLGLKISIWLTSSFLAVMNICVRICTMIWKFVWNPIPKRKCYFCYRHTIARILKYFPRFFVWKWELAFWDLLMTQFALPKALQKQQALTSIQRKKWLSRHLALGFFQLT